MIGLTSPYLWYTARATGVVSLVLLTVTIVLGTLVATRVGGNAVGRFELNEIHRSVSMIAVVFLAIHVLVTVVDTYAPVGWLPVVIPFTSTYRRLPVALGTISIDLMLAVWISSLLKDRIRHVTWRFIHWFSWTSFAVAVVHGFLAGNDARRGWSLILTGVCVALVVFAAFWRVLQRPDRAAGRTAHSPLQPASLRVKGAPSVPNAPAPAARRSGTTRTTPPSVRPPAAPPRAPNSKGRR